MTSNPLAFFFAKWGETDRDNERQTRGGGRDTETKRNRLRGERQTKGGETDTETKRNRLRGERQTQRQRETD